MGKSSNTSVGGEKLWSEVTMSESSLAPSEFDLEAESTGSPRCKDRRCGQFRAMGWSQDVSMYWRLDGINFSLGQGEL